MILDGVLLSSAILRAFYSFNFFALSNISLGRPPAKLLSMLQMVPRTIYDLVIILNLLSWPITTINEATDNNGVINCMEHKIMFMNLPFKFDLFPLSLLRNSSSFNAPWISGNRVI